MEYSIVDLRNGKVVPQFGQDALKFSSLARIRMPDGSTVDGAAPGYEFPPQYPAEPSLPVRYRLYEVIVVDVGSGPRVTSITDPVFDPVADNVTVTRTLEAALPPPDPVDTPLTPEDTERALFDISGMTRARMDEIKRARGSPLP